MQRFSNKVVVVTGGAQGIGEATVKRFVKEGAQVAIIDYQDEMAQNLANKLRKEGKVTESYQCDVTNSEEVVQCFKEIHYKFGRIDVLVNNAGVTRDNLLFKMNENEWEIVIDTHLKGSFLCSREAQKYMVKQKSGKIVMLSSRSALGKRGQTNYAAAKAGIQGMTKTMAIELGPYGINVNAVAPGFIETEMTKSIAERTGVSYEDIKENVIKSNAIKRVGEPQDVASIIAFLASEEASYVTGQVIYVAGNVTN
ncbi:MULTISPECIES: SDR family NAD(P)-dependent oxidoreductase [Bhargavaea]|uniref:SDR family NAD(P)-dependent oxidoreductase n=1 Tax=Bhargavaea changchunensis TaxID=2134037 RepID=A0ABW2NDJ3_9BACL|nr:3-oxoacyl-ACP reductase FabG [Bhargavaea sp. CC-171006]